ncbi:NADH dehydrogenase subunit 5 (mitochondrion) [Limulus polyphemus]|uniref:NADH-ubiquinone oxidoreductase chain 5 n=1 Tax=Limulus polyphemus TaxID=6850 RepID=Q9MLQ1_LIMPO|nr:NADH dehydrogenase subunit 5 [Limulus polyphemus]AAF72115.1 NADH dehydrogenase subunit 5 [Limulus polyphemus]
MFWSVYGLWALFLLLMFVMFFSFSLFFIFSDFAVFVEYYLFSMNGCPVEFMMVFDWVSLMFLSFVMLISSVVIFYSEEYMEGDENLNRFCYLVLLFVLSMGLLILSPNLISILLGWDGLGLVSYCLVIYYQNNRSLNAGMITVLSNRIGDVGILIGIVWMLNFGNWNYFSYVLLEDMGSEFYWVGGCVVLAALTKSAQIPFSAWLPAAMAAPTPVSALVHSSTLVTAGVYLLIRLSQYFSVGVFSCVLMFISCMTMFMSGLGANYEMDMKKVIALSTLSQLGVMMLSISFGYWKLAYFHMLTHALFKALLFLCAGSVIHSSGGAQDLRYMGGMIEFSPVVGSCFNLANLSLCGIPFLAGFYSKDLILENVSFFNFNFFIFIFFSVSIGLTACYSFRLFFYIMGRNFFMFFSNFGEGSIVSVSIIFLSFWAVIMGSTLMWILFPIPCFVFVPIFYSVMGVLCVIVGLWMGLILWGVSGSYLFLTGKSVNHFLGLMWFLPWLSSNPLLSKLSLGGYFLSSDLSWGEWMGPQGVFEGMVIGSSIFQWFQDNNLKMYLVSFAIWVIIFTFLMLML